MTDEERDARPWSWHPFPFAVSPILSLYSTNAQLVPAGDLLWPIGIALVTVALIWAAAWLVLRDCERSALLASVVVGLLWMLSPLARVIGPVRSLTAVALAVLLAVAWLLRSRRRMPALTRGLEVAAIVLLVVSLVPAAWGAWTSGSSADPPALEVLPRPLPEAAGALPDIYYIVLDAYGRPDVLREQYGVRTDLAAELAALGFYVGSRSVSNYNTTLHSIPSSLNFDYIQNLTAMGPPRRLIRRNAVARWLHPLGYRFVAFASGFFLSECPQADEYIDEASSLSEFHAAVLGLSPLILLGPHWRLVSPHRAHRRRILEGFDHLEALADDPRPTFTFMHVMSPHHPFIFGENGEDRARYDLPFDFARSEVGDNNPSPEPMNAEYVEAYRRQATFLSKRVVKAVKVLLERSLETPIIIVQGDHGPNSREPFTVPGERYPILNAYYLPEGGDRALYPGITPVNSFRVVLNRYFDADLELLPDRSYRGTWKRPYHFEEVPDPELMTAWPR